MLNAPNCCWARYTLQYPVPVLLAIMIQLFNKLQQYCNTIALLWSAVRMQKPIPAMLAVSAQMSDQCPPAEQINTQTHTAEHANDSCNDITFL